ncbi:transposase, partial [Legionella sp. PATHC038]
RWYHYGYELRYKKISRRSCPRILGLDEHSFNRKVGYATTFCDLAKHKIFDVVEGRSAKDLESYLKTLEGRDKVLVVCIDLSSSYRLLIRRYFPNAKIVADRFHVIRLLNQMSLQTYQQIDPQIKYQRGLLAALRTNEANLTIKRLNRRASYLQHQPAIAAIYHFKQRLHRLLMKKHRTAKQCKRLLPLFLKYV